MSIGARSQSAKTYLEKHYESFIDCKNQPNTRHLGYRLFTNFYIGDLEQLITHGLHALRETLQQDKELTILNTSIGIVGEPSCHEKTVKSGGSFRILEGEIIASFLSTMTPKETVAAAPEPDTDDEQPAAGDDDVQMSDS